MFYVGIFLRELSNRFLCEVFINNEIQRCYVPSSSKLSKLVDLVNKDVILIENKGKNTKTTYRLFGVKYKNSFVLLDLTYVNNLIHLYLKSKNLDVFREYYLDASTRIDFVVKEPIFRIYEAKGVLTFEDSAIYPNEKPVRAISQLKTLKKKLEEGYKVSYLLVIMNQYVKYIDINFEYDEYLILLCQCINLGMEIKVFHVLWIEKFLLKENIGIQKSFILKLNSYFKNESLSLENEKKFEINHEIKFK